MNFNDLLKADESLFLNAIVLDYDYQPKIVPYREAEMQNIASCIKPLFSKRNGKNLFIHGRSGVGKTVACKHLIKEIEEQSEEVIPIYINCWQRNTSHKMVIEICDVLGYRFTQNKRTEELFEIIKKMLNKKSVVFVFDEIDKVDNLDFLYSILEEIYRKTIILITNYKEWIISLDQRIRSRLTAETLEFKSYNKEETKGILKQRVGYAFVPGVLEESAFNLIVDKTAQIEDIRSGLYLMKEAGNIAENEANKKIKVEHVKKALEKFDDFTIKSSSSLEEETRFILDIIKENSGKRIGDLYYIYQEEGGSLSYKAFTRKTDSLAKNKFISTEKIIGGREGSTTIINYTKKLTEF